MSELSAPKWHRLREEEEESDTHRLPSSTVRQRPETEEHRCSHQEDFDEFSEVDELYSTLPLDKVESLEDLVAIVPPGLVKGAPMLILKTTLAPSASQIPKVWSLQQRPQHQLLELVLQLPWSFCQDQEGFYFDKLWVNFKVKR